MFPYTCTMLQPSEAPHRTKKRAPYSSKPPPKSSPVVHPETPSSKAAGKGSGCLSPWYVPQRSLSLTSQGCGEHRRGALGLTQSDQSVEISLCRLEKPPLSIQNSHTLPRGRFISPEIPSSLLPLHPLPTHQGPGET